MNKVCHIGFSQIQELYEQHVKEIDNALLHSKEMRCTTGMPGEPLPYQLRTDLPITCVVFLCFFLIIYALKKREKISPSAPKDLLPPKGTGRPV